MLSGEVYARDLDGREMQFGSAGAEDGVLVLYDRATRSRWSQVAGRATLGPLAGAKLRKLRSLVTTWARWRALHPDTTVYLADEPSPARPRFTEETVSLAAMGSEGPVRNEDWVLGLEGGSGASVFLYRRLVEARAAHEVFEGRPVVAFLTSDFTTATVWERTVEGRVLTFAARADQLQDQETGTRWDPFTGRAARRAARGPHARAGPGQLRPLVRLEGAVPGDTRLRRSRIRPLTAGHAARPAFQRPVVAAARAGGPTWNGSWTSRCWPAISSRMVSASS